jgi:hypothetical protein
MIDNDTILKVRNWFASRHGMEFTPAEVRTSLERNPDLQRVTPEVVEGMRRDTHVAPLIKEFTAFLLAIKQGEA